MMRLKINSRRLFIYFGSFYTTVSNSLSMVSTDRIIEELHTRKNLDGKHHTITKVLFWHSWNE